MARNAKNHFKIIIKLVIKQISYKIIFKIPL